MGACICRLLEFHATMLSSLGELITKFEHAGQLARISAEASTRLEIPAIARRASAARDGGPALLFEKPSGFPFPVALNVFGSRRRMRLALGVDRLHDLTENLNLLLDSLSPLSHDEMGRQLAALPALLPYMPVTIHSGPCMAELLPDLTLFPFLKNWPDDGAATGNGRYITMGQVITSDYAGLEMNSGIYRCQVHGPQTLAVRWRPGSGASRHFQQFASQGERMPVAIVLGGPPALTLASAWPLPHGLDELTFAGWLRGASIPVVQSSHARLMVPAEAEVVIEGFAAPDETLMEGPFGNHTGLYDPAGPAAKVTVTRITHRSSPVIPATVVGPPPQEDCWMMLAWERLLAALLTKLVPGVRDIATPVPWVFRNSAVVSLEQHSSRNVRDIVHSLWQLPWFRKARLLVLVDSAVPTSNTMQVAWKVVNEVDWLDDLIHDEAGGRMAIDATGRHEPGEELSDPDTQRLIERRWKEYGL